MARTPRNWKRWTIGVAMTVVFAVGVGFAIVSQGKDASEVPPATSSIWVLNRDSGQYARLNTAIDELGSPQLVDNPNGIAQFGENVVLFGSQYARLAAITPSSPQDLSADAGADGFTDAPAGTVSAQSVGDTVAYLTDTGGVYLGTISSGGGANPVAFDDEEKSDFLPTAIALNDDGDLLAYSPSTGDIRKVSAHDGGVSTVATDVSLGDDSTASQLAFTGDSWILMDTDSGRATTASCPAFDVTGAGDGRAKLQVSPSEAGTAYVADPQGLTVLDTEKCTAKDRVAVNGANTPTAPVKNAGTMYAAWIRDTGDAGNLWSSAKGSVEPLDFTAVTEPQDGPVPAFMSNGSAMVLNETKTGLVWTLDGSIVPSSAHWDADHVNEVSTDDQEQQRVTEPKPPVAEPDNFGVRAGRDVVLPVLLNDHDPNEDVLSVLPQSVTGLPEEFGSLRVGNNDQEIVVHVNPEASGTASFTYQITDGTTAADSAPATVTLDVKPDSENSAPQWCGDGIVTGCLSRWPDIHVAQGGTASAEVLRGWVDPEGDPIFLAGATEPQQDGVVVFDPTGTLTYHHLANTDASSSVINVVVSDSYGALSEPKPLSVSMTGESRLAFGGITANGIVGTPVSVNISDEVTGAIGRATLTAVAPDDHDLSTATITDGTTMTVSATSPGTYPIKVTLRDESGTEATGTARVTFVAPEESRISTVPLTAFVRENEDTTVDVLSAVNNPASLALLVDKFEPTVAADASLTANVVESQNIRFSGARIQGGADASPMTLGTATYRVSDGTDAVTTTGQITFVLLPPGDSTPPIAVDDDITVRAGDQIDVPVLDNDVAPAGATVKLDPSNITINQDDWNDNAGLAFGTDRLIRLLAPTAPGEYSISYTIFRLGYPTATSQATLHVTVIGDESNTAPKPAIVTSRVVAGGTVSIPLVKCGSDPDGDSVELDRITSTPARGTASISADGSAIVYTANSGAENAGQDEFTYQVKDFLGQTGTGTVRIGIRSEVDVAPVTYTDYVQVQVNEPGSGTASSAVVFPLRNDVDPQGLTLSLDKIVPNAVQTREDGSENPEYTRLAGLLSPEPNLDSGQVNILAGEQLGTFSYQYTVENDHGDTAIGLIIVKVVNDPVPDFPIIEDTRLTAETRDQLAKGVDVLSGKVLWSTGDINGLTLDLPFDQPGFSVSGWDIKGSVPKASTVIPFRVSGSPFLSAGEGKDVVSYGFLRIPGETDVTLALRAGASITVNEKESQTIDLANAVIYPPSERLEVGPVASGGGRAAASCTVAGTVVTYAAGIGAPWNDTCIVQVRVSSFDEGEYAQLSVPVTVIPEDPTPELRSGAQTVSPGQTQKFDLSSLVTWDRHTPADIAGLQIDATGAGGNSFDVVATSKNSLSIRGLDAAVPGTQVPLSVSLPAHPDVPSTTLVLTVGPAPTELPRGATVSMQCGQAGGSSCSVDVIGQAGEFNPLPGTPLVLVDVSSPANCPGLSFARASDRSVTVSWTPDAAGYKSCTGSFTVKDAQGRVSGGDRVGQIVIDFQALPPAPTGVDWTAYTGDSVTLRVGSPNAYPAVSGYALSMDGVAKGSCSADGLCTVSGLANGEKHSFEVFATNGQGNSRTGKTVQAWAYKAPDAPTGGTAQPILDGAQAKLSITGIDPSTSKLSIVLAGTSVSQTVNTSGTSAETTIPVPSTSNIYDAVVTPVTKFDLPPIPGGSAQGTTKTIGNVFTVGAPSLDVSAQGDAVRKTMWANAVVTAQAPAGVNGLGTKISFAKDGEACSPGNKTGPGSGSFDSDVFTISRGRDHTVTACATTTYGEQSTTVVTKVSNTVNMRVPNANGSPTYAFGGTATSSNKGNTFSWTSVSVSGIPQVAPGEEIRFGAGGQMTSNIQDLFSDGRPIGTIIAYTCESDSNVCSDGGPEVKPKGPAWGPIISFPGKDKSLVLDCPEESKQLQCAKDKAAEIKQWVTSNWSVSDPSGVSIDSQATASDITFTVSFSGSWGLTGVTWTATIDGWNYPPPPEPTPTPTPTDPSPTPTDPPTGTGG